MKKCTYNTTALVVAAMLVMTMPAAAYTIDGHVDDWNTRSMAIAVTGAYIQ